MPNALLFVQDEEELETLSKVFEDCGYSVRTAPTLAAAKEALIDTVPEVALLDLDLSEDEEYRFLNDSAIAQVMDVFLMTSTPSLRGAVRGMRVGASDYFSKPVDAERLREALEQASGCASEGGEDPEDEPGLGLLYGRSRAMQHLFRLLRKVSPAEMTVLLVGESGVGKELAARTVHQLSPRSAGPFLAVNCGSISPEIMESELFGHERGSFTGAHRKHKGFFERADRGTLFLDEITETDPALQVKLLRVLETGSFPRVGGEEEISSDLRLIAATNQDPEEAVNSGKLREDLYYRLAQFPIRVPALRERGEDIIGLAELFVDELNAEHNANKELTDRVRERLKSHDWPGNVREMKNAIGRAWLLAGTRIEENDLPGTVLDGGLGTGDYLRLTIGQSLKEVERRAILATLEHYEGEKKKTASTLGISLKTLYTKLKKYRSQGRGPRD